MRLKGELRYRSFMVINARACPFNFFIFHSHLYFPEASTGAVIGDSRTIPTHFFAQLFLG
jgi:hypothetical protein